MLPIASAFILLLATLCTAFLSGIFGMAGGLILMGILLSLVSVPQAMVAHGLLQMVANGWRSYLLRTSIRLDILTWYCLGAILAIGILFLIAWRPSRQMVFVLLGIVPFFVWLPKSLFHLDAERPFHALLAGLFVTSLNTFAGVAGPALDIFFVQTSLTRHQIVATKSITQMVAHFVKIIFWSGIAFAGAVSESRDLLLLIALAVPLSMTGTWMGGKVLNRMSDKSFLRWVKALVSVIGLVYLLRAGLLFVNG
jgi:uncharacterized membrane protein YfcA